METAKKIKVAVIRKSGYPVGSPAPCFLNCPCGAEPPVPSAGSTIGCSCGTYYDAHGWIVTPASKLTRIKVLTGYAAHSRFLAEICREDEEMMTVVGEIPRPDVPQPYSYSATQTVYAWNGRGNLPIIIVETRHRRYEVFRVDGKVDPIPEEG